jgi:ankyrin repeat protein
MGAGPSHPSDSVVFWLQVPNFAQVKSLLAKKDVNEAVNNYGDTALHYSAYLGYVDLLEWLLQRGADRDVKNQDGFTALELAEQSQQSEAVALLQKS